MNSEELEMSLRTEFESHLKVVFAKMRQDFSQFQEKVTAELEKHRAHLDTVFQEFPARFENETELDQGFKEVVVEHLRLARDEGARLTANAIAEAEELQRQSAPPEIVAAPPVPTVEMSELRDAINDITAQDSQGTILKSLVQYAAQYTPRGAFFIIKNERFIGWRIFNKEGEANETAVREVNLPIAADSILGESVRSLSAVESSFGTYSGDAQYLRQIGFGEPERMMAIPLVVRGRGVAVLYADYGEQGEQVNVEVLETLVRVAALTVEVQAASSQSGKYVQPNTPETAAVVMPSAAVDNFQPVAQIEEKPAESLPEPLPESLPEPLTTEVMETAHEEVPDTTDMVMADATETATSDSPHVEPAEQTAVAEPEAMPMEEEYSGEIIEDAQIISVEPMTEAEAEADYSTRTEEEDASKNVSAPVSTDFQFTVNQDAENAAPENFNEAKFDRALTEIVEPVAAPSQFSPMFEQSNGNAAAQVTEPAVNQIVPVVPAKSRFGDRNVDLPIEVSEDERRLHNDARRFARLLVSEIKLYNEQKVKEGRESRDLYDRLREAIDRSRDMYDKRVQPPVAAKFDYFHYELVSTLAEGEPLKLGGDYPGANA
ncbi:MAG: hypothetical protein M3T96_02245 [Acidobacteriota bacterium]|nr:hypothetical protein [Acidobacteriota bacterium]